MRAASSGLRSRRSSRFRSAPFVLLLAISLGSAAACGSGSSSGASTPARGSGDQPENGRVSVEEADLRGSISDGTLEVTVPVTSLLSERGSGKLVLHLTSVDGGSELGSVELPYDLAAGEKATLSASLAAPPGLQTQSDLVLYNLRLDDGAEKGGLHVTRSLMYVVPLLELRVEGPATLRPGRDAYYRLRVEDTLEGRPVEAQSVRFELLQDGAVVQTHDVTTEPTGDAEVKLEVEAPGDYTVHASMLAQGTSTELEDPMKVDAGLGKLLLTSDKPIYQPGQLIHLRALSLAREGNKPIAGESATFEVEDGKGNKVFKRATRTDRFGAASAEFAIGSIVNEGTYKLRVVSSGVTSEKTVNVSHYALPKFDVGIKTEEPWYAPGATVAGSIDSRYFFGKPVTGSVTVEAYSVDVGSTLFQRTMGTLNAEGHYDFSLVLPSVLPGLPLEQGNAAVELRVTVVDSAGQKVEKSRLLTISKQGATVVLVPESGTLVPNIENELLLFASDPLGAPLAHAAVKLTAPDESVLDATTDDYGQATLSFTPEGNPATGGRFSATVTLEGGTVAATTFDFKAQAGAQHLLLRTDKSVYELGDEVEVDITSTERDGVVYVDWLNDGQTVDMRTLTAHDGVAKFRTSIDASLAGSNRIEAYLVDDDGQVVRSGRTIFARNPSALNVAIAGDQKQYAPGAQAKLTLSVTDETGKPAVAALGVQIVDQAVFSLIDAKPGLLRTYFEIEDQLSKPQYEIHPPEADLSELLFSSQKSAAAANAAQQAAGASFAAMKGSSLSGIQHGSLSSVLTVAGTNLEPSFSAVRLKLRDSVVSVGKQTLTKLKSDGCEPYNCPGGNFSTRFNQGLQTALVAYDFWGNRFRATSDYSGITLTSAGADERFTTTDDRTLSFPLSELQLPIPTVGGPAAGPGFDGNVEAPAEPPAGEGDTGSATDGGSMTADSGSTGPRVRSDFPETLYVNPSIITDENGQATLDLSMADGITEWRVSALANSADGRLGGSEGAVKVFQDFFVDVSFPAALTRGDEVTFPVAVYNYLDTPQTVNLSLQAGSWYTALGSTMTSVKLDPGQVTGVSFPVKVNSVGLQTLTVTAQGDQKSDAVARTVRVVPDGKAFPTAFSGSLDRPSQTYAVTFPPNDIPGSEQLYVDIFPAFLAQAVQGMDSILKQPTGCFEQTTSSAWPNVLVTEYMQDTKQITPEVQLKAEALMSTGYQRLLTFEHKGGGFSWFGEQDPAPYLSVTAFGIMEFSDMARVHDVDPAMLARTVAWIESQQQADGSFKGDMSEFFSFHTSVVRNTAFTAWALASAGETGSSVTRALDYVSQHLQQETDAYTLGIVANAFALGAPKDPQLTAILSQLDGLKIVDGDFVHWDSGGSQTNFYGGGDDAAVSATALVALSFLQTGSYPKSVDGALKYLTSKKDPSGNFGSTQATIWTLRALLLAAKKGTSGAVGSFSVSLDGKLVQSVALNESQADVMTRVDLSALATLGSHDVALAFTGSGKPSYNLVESHNLAWSDVPAEPAGPLSVAVSYDKSELFVSDLVKAKVTLTNNQASLQNMVLLTLGIAPGFNVDTSSLQKYLDDGSISKFETTGRQLILYLTTLAPNASKVFEYSLQAVMPVTAVDGGAEAKLYYEPEKKAHAASQSLNAMAR